MDEAEKLKALLAEMKASFEQFKKDNDAKLVAIEAKGGADPLLTEKLNKQNEAMNKLEEQIRALKVAAERGIATPTSDVVKQLQKTLTPYLNVKGYREIFADEKGDVKADVVKEYSGLCTKYLRGHGTLDLMTDAERTRFNQIKSMISGNDPQGGYVVNPVIGAMIATKVFELSPFRQYMGQITINSDSYEPPTDGDEAACNFEGEITAAAETATPVLGKYSIPVKNLLARPLASENLLEDASVDIESWIGMKVANAFARKEANHFAVGDGVLGPRGFTSYDAGTGAGQIEQIVSGHATLLNNADKLISIVAALKTAYKQNGAGWFMTRTTKGVIRALKDANGQYLWQPGLGGMPSTLLEFPVYEAADMPEIGANTLPVAFGNFQVGYLIVDRVNMSVLRDPYTADPYIKFKYRKRVGGAVVVHEAIKLLKISA